MYDFDLIFWVTMKSEIHKEFFYSKEAILSINDIAAIGWIYQPVHLHWLESLQKCADEEDCWPGHPVLRWLHEIY